MDRDATTDLYLLGGSGDVSLFHDTPRHAALPASPGQQTTLVDMPIVKNSPPPLYGTATTMLEPEPGTSDAPMMYMLGINASLLGRRCVCRHPAVHLLMA